MERQRAWETGEIDKERMGIHDSRRKSWIEERLKRSEMAQEEREQEREADVTN